MSDSDTESRAYERELEDMVAKLETMLATCEEDRGYWHEKAEKLTQAAKKDDKLIEDLNAEVLQARAARQQSLKKVITLEITNDKLENDLRMVEMKLHEKEAEIKELKENQILVQMDFDFFKESKSAEILALTKKIYFLQSFQQEIEQSTEITKLKTGSRRGSIDQNASSRCIAQLNNIEQKYETRERLLARARRRVSVDPTCLFPNKVNSSSDTIVEILGSLRRAADSVSKCVQTEYYIPVKSDISVGNQTDQQSNTDVGVQVNLEPQVVPKADLLRQDSSISDLPVSRSQHQELSQSSLFASRSVLRQKESRQFNLEECVIDEGSPAPKFKPASRPAGRSRSPIFLNRLLQTLRAGDQ